MNTAQSNSPEKINTSNDRHAQNILDNEVDLLIYLHAILNAKYRIIIIAIFGATLSFATTFLIDKTYLSNVVVAINIDEKPGGVKPSDYRSGDTIGLLERDFLVQSAPPNEFDRILTRMGSSNYSKIFILENNLMPYIFEKEWDPQKNKWIDIPPDIRNGIKIFQEEIRYIDHDIKTGLLKISFMTRDPDQSAKLANLFVEGFNKYSKQIALIELSERKSYLEKRLRDGANLELQRSIYRLLETQLAAESLIHARGNFPLEVIQPANPPLLKYKPKRLLTAAMTFISLMFIGVTIVIGRVIFRRVKANLAGLSASALSSSTTGASPTGLASSDWHDER